jgi:hypothetical protein
MMRPLALDLFCCAGGVAEGLHRAGYQVVGVDIDPQRWTSAAAETSPGDVHTMKEALKAAIRAAKLAIFTIRKQGVMPNSSWEAGFNCDLARAESGLAAIDHLDVKAEAKSQEPDAVAIKPLEWVHVPSGRATSERYDAITLAGVYSVYLRDNGDVQWAINHSAPVNFVDGLSCAKAAAQEDYEHRIRAALIHPTKAPAVSVDAIKAAVTKELSHPEDDAIASRIATTIAALIARGR